MTSYLLPWKKTIDKSNNNAECFVRHVYSKRTIYQIVFIDNKWWAWSDIAGNSLPYDTVEEAMKSADDCFRDRGYILLTEETMMLI